MTLESILLIVLARYKMNPEMCTALLRIVVRTYTAANND
jgi:hypothetical protein